MCAIKPLSGIQAERNEQKMSYLDQLFVQSRLFKKGRSTRQQWNHSQSTAGNLVCRICLDAG